MADFGWSLPPGCTQRALDNHLSEGCRECARDAYLPHERLKFEALDEVGDWGDPCNAHLKEAHDQWEYDQAGL